MILSCEPLQAELRPLLWCWYSSYFRAYIRKAVQQTPEHLLTFSNKEIMRACRKLVSDRKKWGTENKMGKKILKYISDPIKKKVQEKPVTSFIQKSRISTPLPLQCRLGTIPLQFPRRAVQMQTQSPHVQKCILTSRLTVLRQGKLLQNKVMSTQLPQEHLQNSPLAFKKNLSVFKILTLMRGPVIQLFILQSCPIPAITCLISVNLL